jgi:hypothetical protein
MNLTFDRDSNFKTNQINSVSSGNHIEVQKFGGSSSPSHISSDSSPKLFSSMLPEKKSKFIPPQLSKRVPVESFGGLVNTRKTVSPSQSSNSSIEDDDSDDSDEDLSNYGNQQQNSSSSYKNKYASSNDDDDDDSSDSSDDMMSQGESSVSSGSSDSSAYSGNESVESYQAPRKTYEEIQKEKQQILFDLDRLQKQGFPPSKKYHMGSTYEDMVYERDKLKKQRDVEKSIKFSRKALMMVVSGIEFLNGKFDPFDVRLDGWSEKIMEDITDYDEIFEELHEKYGESVKTAPELRLLLTLAGSGFMFHLTNSLFKSASPDLNDILKKNPDIMRNITEAAARNMQQNVTQQMGTNDPIGNMMNQGIQMKMGAPPAPQQTRAPPRSPMSMGPSRPLGAQPTMRGPSGDVVNDLLKGLGESGNSRDDDTGSESSYKIRMGIRNGSIKKGKKGGIELDLT